MTQCIDIYTGVHADNIDKKKPGAAFGAVVVSKSRTKVVCEYNPTATYMQIWMSNIAFYVSSIAANPLADREEITLFIHTWTPNINKMCKKMQSIFDQLREYDEDAWDVLDIKLRRANRQRYEYHNDMATVVRSLLSLSKICTKLNFKFIVSPPRKHPHMSIAYQKAEQSLSQG